MGDERAHLATMCDLESFGVERAAGGELRDALLAVHVARFALLDELRHQVAAAREAPDDRLLTVPEAAARLRVSETTVKARLRAGELPGRRVGKVWRIEAAALSRGGG